MKKELCIGIISNYMFCCILLFGCAGIQTTKEEQLAHQAFRILESNIKDLHRHNEINNKFGSVVKDFAPPENRIYRWRNHTVSEEEFKQKQSAMIKWETTFIDMRSRIRSKLNEHVEDRTNDKIKLKLLVLLSEYAQLIDDFDRDMR